MTTHPDSTEPCCEAVAIGALEALVRLTREFSEEAITRELIVEAYPGAEAFVRARGHRAGNLDRDLIVGHVMMRFTIFQPEAHKLDGREIEHKPWLHARKSEIFSEHGFWDNYRRLLETRLPESPRNRLDEITDQILDSLEDPTRLGQWDRRGLVMGHVQSGKTNNYIGLICKAADAGYKLIIVLSGMHNNLRAQTQFRIDEGFVGRDTRDERGAESIVSIGVGRERDYRRVISLTSAADDGDFNRSAAAVVSFDFGSLENPTVFVVKKNVSILRNLHEWLNQNAPRPAGHERIAGIPVLMIDDEADSASINTANNINDPEAEPTAINRSIRKVLNLFDQTGFVGYTATPFANIFIPDRPEEQADFGEDLFPRDFIFSLPAPSDYVGPEFVFGLAPATDPGGDQDDRQVASFVYNVFDSEEWVPGTHRADLKVAPSIFPESLQRAIQSFVLSSAARRVRGQGAEDHSMLIHVTPFVGPQAQVRDQVDDFVRELSNDLLYNRTSNRRRDELESIWHEDFIPQALALQERIEPSPPVHDFAELNPELAASASKIVVRLINGTSSDVLDYHRFAEGLSAIVIGGAKLSRGLTLEGLSISYYLRASRMYDTLMQMGRWFGYRPGYLDLCRIFTPPSIADWYRNISTATRELLVEFEEMEREGASPRDFGLKVRHSPGMLVTSQAKMRHGTRQRVSFGRTRPETTTFFTDPESRRKCLEILESFVATLGTPDTEWLPQYGWQGVAASDVVAYFRRLEREGLYERSLSGLPRYIADYIEERGRAGGLTHWTVYLKSVTGADTNHPVADLEVGLAERRDQGSAALGTYSIKSLIGSQDEAFDLTEAERARARELAPEGHEPYGVQFRKVRPTERGLLILYLLSGIQADGHENGVPFAAYCVSFPDDPEGTSIEYIVNNVHDSPIREG